MSTTLPTPPAHGQAVPQQPYPAPQQQAYWQAPPAAGPAKPPAEGSWLRRWPAWAQNTALAVGAVAVLVVVFFGGFFTGHVTSDGVPGGGTNQDFSPRQFGNGNGFGGQGQGQSGNGNGFGGGSSGSDGTGSTGSGDGS
jgi:uncharacterized membrane protein YgcG